MSENKNSKKGRIEKLRSVLDNPSSKDLHHKDEKYLITLSRRLKQSPEIKSINFKAEHKKYNDSDVKSLEPIVTIYVRGGQTIAEVDFVSPEEEIKEEKKRIKIEDNFIEVEKFEVEGPKFIEVIPKEPAKKIKEDEEFKKQTIAEEGLMEWEAVEKPEIETEIKEEVKAEVWEPLETEEKKIEEEPKIEEQNKIDTFKELKNIDNQTAIILYDHGYRSIEDLKNADYKKLKKIKGIKRKQAKQIIKEIEEFESNTFVEVEEVEVESKSDIRPADELEEEIKDQEEVIEGVFIQEMPEGETFIKDEKKIEIFKDLDSVDKKTSILLYDTGYTSLEELEKSSEKDLRKIEGIKRKQAKQIMKEIDKIKIFKDLKSVSNKKAILLYDNGYTSIEDLKKTNTKELEKIEGIGKKTSEKIIREIKKIKRKNRVS